MKSESCSPSLRITWATAMARAPSEPGLMGSHSSALEAVTEYLGSNDTTLVLFGNSRRSLPHRRRFRASGLSDSTMPELKARMYLVEVPWVSDHSSYPLSDRPSASIL